MTERRYKWLIDLRWLAAVGILLANLVSSRILHINVYQPALYTIAGVLLLLNFLYLLFYHRYTRQRAFLRITIENLVVIQIVTDLILLTFLLHFTGGVENPFIIYYIFHLMLASILLPRTTSYLLASFTMFLVAVLAIGEFKGWIRHYELIGFLDTGFYNNARYLAGTGVVFVTTSYVVVYMTSSVSTMLRIREQAYREANRELLNKDTVKDEYVSRITHDIKGHLAAIKNCLDASLTHLPAAQKKDFVLRARTRTEKLIAFIQDLLRITRLRLRNEMIFTEFSIKNEIDELIASYSREIEERNISIQNRIEVDNVVADQLSIREVFENLFSNSIKYTGEGGRIGFRSSVSTEGTIILEVEDTGIGIPKGEEESIFMEFYRAGNNSSGIKEGNGMGLAIVSRIVKNHKGTIQVISEESHGSCFRIELPLLPVESEKKK
jgi:signal transduction histidine kinase